MSGQPRIEWVGNEGDEGEDIQLRFSPMAMKLFRDLCGRTGKTPGQAIKRGLEILDYVSKQESSVVKLALYNEETNSATLIGI